MRTDRFPLISVLNMDAKNMSFILDSSPLPLGTDVSSFTCRYDAQGFTEQLFEQFGIHCPEHILNASVKRKSEYLAGRYCIKMSMPDYLKEHHVASYRNTPPHWPADVIGSVSHTRDMAIAAVSSTTRYLAIGIDCERLLEADTSAKIRDQILSDNDKAHLQTTKADFCTALTAIFSAKESLFKALNPIVGRFFGFRDVDVDLADDMASFTATLNKGLTEAYPPGQSFSGSIMKRSGNIITYLAIKRRV